MKFLKKATEEEKDKWVLEEIKKVSDRMECIEDHYIPHYENGVYEGKTLVVKGTILEHTLLYPEAPAAVYKSVNNKNFDFIMVTRKMKNKFWRRLDD